MRCLVPVFQVDVELEDLNNRHDQMLVNEFLSKLDLDIKLSQTFVILDVEFLREEEWHLFRIVRNLVHVDLLSCRPSHVLFEHDWTFLFCDFGVRSLTCVDVL